MPVNAKRLNDTEPIVVFTYEGDFTSEMFGEVMALNAKYIEEIGQPIYIIADMTLMQPVGFKDMLEIMNEAVKDDPGSAQDPNLKMLVFVGSPSILKMYRNTMQNRKVALPMILYDTIDEALEVVRAQLELDAKSRA